MYSSIIYMDLESEIKLFIYLFIYCVIFNISPLSDFFNIQVNFKMAQMIHVYKEI